jgi:hypothetical protein
MVLCRIHATTGIIGDQTDDDFPFLLKATDDTSTTALLALTFETKPLQESSFGKPADSVLRLALQPVDIVFRPNTLDYLASFFARERDLALEEVTAAVASKAADLKTYTQTSLKYAVETHHKLELDVSVSAPTFILLGLGGTSAVVVDLGTLNVKSKYVSTPISTAPLVSHEELYDTFDCNLCDLQILVFPHGSQISLRFVTIR